MVGLYSLSHYKFKSWIWVFSHQNAGKVYVLYAVLARGRHLILAICAFIGHRKVENTETLKEHLAQVVKMLIVDEGVDTFLFGSRSAFNDISYDIVTELKEIHTNIRRVFVRAEYEYIDKLYTDYLLTFYEDTYFAEQAHNAGYRSYVKRNQEMIDKSNIVVAYCDMSYKPTTRTKSGTIMAVQYAQKKQKRIINIFDLL